MGYLSSVRIRLTKEDYQKLIKENKENQILNKKLDIFKENKNFEVFTENIKGEYDYQKVNAVYFGWDNVKWYGEDVSVVQIMDFIQTCDKYAFCRIGNYEGDIEHEEKVFNQIITITTFAKKQYLNNINYIKRKIKKMGTRNLSMCNRENENAFWGFYCLNDDITEFGKYFINGGCECEMCMEWELICGKYVPRLKIFDDAWCSLIDMIPLFTELSKHNNKNITQTEFIDILKKLNFKEI